MIKITRCTHYKYPWINFVTFTDISTFMGCGMGTLFVFVSPCFRENVVVTWKTGSFLRSLDNLLKKNVIAFFFGN